MNFPSRVVHTPAATGTGAEYPHARPAFSNLLVDGFSQSYDLFVKIHNRLDEQTRFQAECSRQFQKLDRNLGLVSSYLKKKRF